MSASALGNILSNDRIEKVSNALAEGEVSEQKDGEEEKRGSTRKPSTSAWTPASNVDEGFGSRQRNKRSFKERGSLISRLSEEVAIPNYSRASNARLVSKEKEKEKMQKAPKAVKPASVDVFIPSVVSVGNLAKSLNVTLGMGDSSFSATISPLNSLSRTDRLRRKMIQVGMEAEASHDHSMCPNS